MARRKTNELEDLVNTLADSLVNDVEAFPLAAAPFGQVPLSRDEQMERYHQVRDKPEAWTSMISERGHREVLRYARTMERQHRRMMETNNGRTIEYRDERDEPVGDNGVDRQPDQ